MAKRELKFVAKFQSDIKGLKPIENKLKELGNIKLTDLSKGLKEPEKVLKDIQEKAVQLQGILKRSFNTDLGTLNFKKFNEELNKANLSIKDFSKSFANAGEKGQESLMSLNSLLTNTTKIAKQGGQVIENIWKTFANAAKWSIAYGFINKIADGIRSSYEFTKDLESSLNNIRVVTGKSSEDMEKFARQANTAASNLGKTTKEYTKASLLFYQQGLSDKDVAARTNVTLKAANVTGQDAQAVSQQLTAIWNGYKVSAEEAELYIDKVAAVAATTASNLEELSEGMSKVASAASTMGVDIDELNAQLSTIISVTRQDAATAGTALKTIYARMTDIESGLDTETTLGEYTAKMAQFGIQVLDSKGALRDVGDVMQEIGDKWDGFTKTQQVALAQAMAGTRQYNNLMALFGNWDMYTKSLETSRDAMGTLQNQQDIYMESLEGHLAQLQAAGEKVYLALFDSDSFKSILEFLTNLIDKLAFVIDSLGGIGPIATAVGGILIQVFSSQLATGITNVVTNLQNFKKNTEENKNALKVLSDVIKSNAIPELGQMEDITAVLRRKGIVTEEEKNELIGYVSRLNDVKQALDEIKQRKEELAEEKVNLEKEIQVSEAEEQRSFDDFLKMGNNDLSRPLKGFSLDMPIEEAQKYEEAISNIEETYSRAETMTDNFFESVEKLNAAFNKGETIDQNSTVFKRYQETYSNLEENIRIYQKSLERLGDNEAAASLRKTKTELEGIREAFNKAAKSKNGLGKEQMVALYKQVAELNKEVDKVQVRIDKAVDTAKRKLKGEAGSDSSEIKEKKEALEAANKEAEELEKKEADIGEEGERVKVKLKDMLNSKEMQAGAQELTKITGALTQGVALVQMGAGVAKTLTDDSKSAGDKVKVVLTTAITMLPIVISLVMTLASANWAAMAPLLPVVGIILGVIAAIAVLTLAVKSISDAFDKEEKALDKANDSLKKQTELYNDAKNAYEELKSSIENYKNAQKAIDEMTKGTQEWKDAIQEANEQVLELMGSYPELASYIKSENGRLLIDEAGLAMVEAEKRRETNEALARKINAQQAVRSAQETLDAKNLNKELGTGQGAGDYWGSLISGLLFSPKTIFQGWQDIVNGDVWKGLGEFIPLVGAFIAAADDQIDAQQRATTKTEEALSRLADAYLVRGEEVFLGSNIDEILGDDFGSLTETIKDNIDAIKDNTIAIAASKQAQDIENQEIMRSWFEGNSTAFAESTDKIAKAITTGTTGKAYQKALEEAEKKWEDKGHLGGGITDAEVQAKYAQMIGAEDYKNEGSNRGSYLIDGEWKTYSDKTARSALAQKEAMEAIGKDFDFAKAIKLSEKLTNKFGEKTSSVLANLAGGKSEISLEELSNKQREALLNELKSFGEEEAKVLGYKSKEALQDALNNSINAAEDMWNSASEGMSEEFKIYFKNVNLKSYKAIADAMKKMDNASQNAIYNTLDQITDEYDKEQFAKAIAETDWTQFNAKDKFQELLQGYSVNISTYAEQINSISDTFFSKISDPDTWNTENVYKYLESIEKVSKSLKSFGDVISKEDFQEYSVELQKYFIKVGEDSYALITSKLAFEEARQKEANEKINSLLTRFDGTRVRVAQQEYDSLIGETKNIEKSAKSSAYYNKADFKEKTSEERIELSNEIDTVEKVLRTTGKEHLKERLDLALETAINKGDKSAVNVLKSIKGYYEKNNIEMTPETVDAKKLQFINSWIPIQESKAELTNRLNYLLQVKNAQEKLQQASSISAEKVTETDVTDLISNFQGVKSRTVLDQLNQIADEILKENGGYDWSNFADDEQIAARKAAIEEAKEQAALKIKFYETQKEIAFAQSKVEAATEGVNAALEKYNQILSNLQKTAKSFALTEEEITENLDAQIDATKETLEQNKKLLNFYSEGGEQQQFLKDQLKIKSLDSDSQSKINNLFNNVTADTLDAALIQAQAIVDAAVSDPTAAVEVYNQIKESLTGEVSRQSNYLKTKGTIIDNTVSLAQAEVQKLRNISDDYIKLLDSEKNINEFLRKITESQKNYGNIGDSYLSDYTIATEKYDKYSKSVANQMERIKELKGKALLTTDEAAELEELQNKVVEDQKGLQDSILARQEAIQKVEETRLNLGQKINEQYEKQIKSAENLISIINHQIKLNKILNGEKAYGVLSGNYQGIYEQREEQRQLALSKYNEAWFTYNELGPNATDEVREKALNDIVETGKAALTSIEQTLDAAKQAFEYNIKATLDAVASYSIAQVESGINNYNWQYDFDTNHMSGLTRDLQLSNLGIKYQKAINQYAADESAQKRLLSVYQEVNKVLEKKETITKNDIALAEKRLALEQARIDLENAQNDTSKMKLVRGANGEYTYQYMADENNILDKMAAYNTAELNYQEAVRASIKDTTSEVTKLIDLFNQLSTAETDEEREEIWNRIVKQIGALKNSAEGLDLSTLPKSVQTFIEEWTSKGSASLDKLKKDCKDIADNYETVKTSMQEASVALTGTGADGEQSLTAAIGAVKDNADKLQGALDNMKSTFDDPKDGLLKKVVEFKTSLSTAIDEITSQAKNLINQLGVSTPSLELISRDRVSELWKTATSIKTNKNTELDNATLNELKKYMKVAEELGLTSEFDKGYADLFDGNNIINGFAYRQVVGIISTLQSSLHNYAEGRATGSKEQVTEGAASVVNYINANFPGADKIEDIIDIFTQLFSKY